MVNLKEDTHVEEGHPRAESIRIREKLTGNVETKVLALAGLIAHGRGEAFDYILGEKTTNAGMRGITAAAAALLLAKHPVISVNGNAAALCAEDIVRLSTASGAKLEVNIFHRLPGREEAIERVLKRAGAKEILGVGEAASARIKEVFSERRRVDPKGIYAADVVLVPLEDGDRTEGLVRMGKTVITVDLNPLSRTAQFAGITIVDNLVRAMPLLVSEVERLKPLDREELKRIMSFYSNREALSESIKIMEERLHSLAEKGIYIKPDVKIENSAKGIGEMEREELKGLKGVRKITVLTAYDYQMARIQDRGGIDIILVGDSLGMVVLGYADTKQVTMRDMIRHTEAVAKGVERALVVADLPIGSYGTVEDALENVNRLLEAGAQAVKIEGNHPEVIRRLISSGIPVMGHLGLLPQTAEVMRVKGKKKEEADRILSDAIELDGLGVFSIVLECIPIGLAKMVTESVEALTIGIGAGVHCDGQVLVVNDMLGMDEGYSPRHSKVYVDLNTVISDVVQRYIEDVKAGKFPTKKQSFR